MGRKLHAVYEAYGPQVLAQLAEAHDNSLPRVFGTETAAGMAACAVTAPDRLKLLKLMESFIAQTCPAGQRNVETVRWICRAYLSHRHNGRSMLAEDLYKLREDLEYLDALKSSVAFKASGKSGDIQSYASYDALIETLRPFQAARSLRAESRAVFHVSPEQRQVMEKETTVLYDGPEGKVVIPHTPRASQYWGRNTKWCISGTGAYASLDSYHVYADVHFPEYNKKSPIVMLLPKKGGAAKKVALVDGQLWNAEDKKISALPDEHKALWSEMRASQSSTVAKSLSMLIPAAALVNEPSNPYELIIDADLSAADALITYPELRSDPTAVLAALAQYGGSIKYAAPELFANRDFLMAAVKMHGDSLRRAPLALRSDRDVVLQAVRWDGMALKHAAAELREDRQIVLAAVCQNGHALYDSYALKNDREIVLAAIQNQPDAIQYISDELQADPEIAWSVIMNGPQYERYMHYEIVNRLRPEIPVRRIRYIEHMIAQGETSKASDMLRHHSSVWGDADCQYGDLARGGIKSDSRLFT